MDSKKKELKRLIVETRLFRFCGPFTRPEGGETAGSVAGGSTKQKGRSSWDATSGFGCDMTFFEIIESLINVTNVPEAKRSGVEYEAARKLIHESLSCPEDVEAASYHEAGHWAFGILVANQLGVDGSLFDVVGPRIKYDTMNNLYDATPTGLSLPGMKNWKAQDEDDVMAMARIAVAGGESIHHYYGPQGKRGDKNDRCRFDAFCKDARLRLGGPIQPPHVYWDQAIADARGTNFKDVLFTSVIESKAALVRQQQFGPVFRSDTKATL